MPPRLDPRPRMSIGVGSLSTRHPGIFKIRHFTFHSSTSFFAFLLTSGFSEVLANSFTPLFLHFVASVVQYGFQ